MMIMCLSDILDLVHGVMGYCVFYTQHVSNDFSDAPWFCGVCRVSIWYFAMFTFFVEFPKYVLDKTEEDVEVGWRKDEA